MSKQDRIQLFDTWAADYDRIVEPAEHPFPHDGYHQVLKEVVLQAAAQPSMLVLDLGVGTGNLAARFVALGCTVWGIDFSPAMLAKARQKIPEANLVQVNLLDLLESWPVTLPPHFDCIVSSYVFHEFDLATKIRLLQKLSLQNLSAGGHTIIADIAFATVHDRNQARQQWADRWDEEEHYWAADEAIAACGAAGL